MIKVQNDITTDKKDPLGSVLQDKQVHEYLRDMGINLAEHCHPDYVFTTANGLKEPKENSIAFERIDGCQVKNKHLLKDKNIKKLVKMYKYHGTGVNNLSCVDGRIFTRLLAPIEDCKAQRTMMSEKDLSKVALGVNFLHYKRHDQCEQKAIYLEKKTTKDIFFAGSTSSYGKNNHHSGGLIKDHRIGCVNAINKLDCDKLVNANKAYRGGVYLDHIASAKITVSPWGWGESCYRDYEALMLRTDVIKPRSYKMESLPEIYNGTVFYCNPDWSNLEEVVDKCLSTWDKRADLRERIAVDLIEWRQPEAIARILSEIVKEAV